MLVCSSVDNTAVSVLGLLTLECVDTPMRDDVSLAVIPMITVSCLFDSVYYSAAEVEVISGNSTRRIEKYDEGSSQIQQQRLQILPAMPKEFGRWH